MVTTSALQVRDFEGLDVIKLGEDVIEGIAVRNHEAEEFQIVREICLWCGCVICRFRRLRSYE